MSKHPLRLKQDNHGFSMVELALVVAIFAIMAGMSIPMLNSAMRDMRLIGDARSIASSLNYSRLSAASQMTHYRISFDLNNNRWQTAKLNRASGSFEIQGSVNPLTNAGTSSETTFRSTTSASSPPSGFSSSSSATITFNSRGIPLEGPSVVYISNSTSQYAVTVSIAGKVQLLRFTQSQWVSN
jgi:prepilin-type N-terminal cleavage/methylation domain-containing protein